VVQKTQSRLAAITEGGSVEDLPDRVKESLKAEGQLILSRLEQQGIFVAKSEFINLLVTGKTSFDLSNLKFRVRFKNLPIVTKVCIHNEKNALKK
jgi:hypothetical protein